jgi:hypothetical protein
MIIPARSLDRKEVVLVKIINANIVTAFSDKTIGTKVTVPTAFMELLTQAVEAFDFKSQRIPGQGFIQLPAVACNTVSAGVGRVSKDPLDYVLRSYRGVVTPFLKRENAADATGVAAVVYTIDAYLADPDVAKDLDECFRCGREGATHVLVTVLAFAGPKPPLTPYRLVHNLAGGNKEALVWTADEIRAKAVESIAYDKEWATVAD